MSELSMPVVGFLCIACLAVGIGAGYFACYRRQQQHGGGRTAAELRVELDAYRERVAASFERSAVLYHELDARHRELHRHLADDAARLVEPVAGRQRLGFGELSSLTPLRDEARVPDPPRKPDFPAVVVAEPADDLPAGRQTGAGR